VTRLGFEPRTHGLKGRCSNQAELSSHSFVCHSRVSSASLIRFDVAFGKTKSPAGISGRGLLEYVLSVRTRGSARSDLQCVHRLLGPSFSGALRSTFSKFLDVIFCLIIRTMWGAFQVVVRKILEILSFPAHSSSNSFMSSFAVSAHSRMVFKACSLVPQGTDTTT
jgi:hypothetical protein